MSNIVAIVGRPNVGKSTFFNRMTGTRKAIVHEESGVTRDRHYGRSDWNGYDFSLVDTGGYVTNSDDVFEEEIRKQVVLAIAEADVIFFIVDVLTGITDLDETIAHILRKSNKKVFMVVNKVDNAKRMYDANEFYRLGIKEMFPVSSINGSGTGELLDALVKEFKNNTIEYEEKEIPSFAVVGKPNVGKSTLINTLIGEERNIVTPVAGTTRDTISTRYNKYGHDFFLVDTAGVRKKGKVHENVEFYSVMRSIRAIENSDVSILLIDATMGMQAQDMNIFRLVKNNHKGIVIVVNKWDLIEKEKDTHKTYEAAIKKRIAPFSDVPVIFASALSKQRINRILETAMKVYNNRLKRIPTSQLNSFLQQFIENYKPPAVRGRAIKIKYATQLPSHAPSFGFFCNYPDHIKEAYKRYLENSLRKHFDLTGVPIKLFFRKK